MTEKRMKVGRKAGRAGRSKEGRKEGKRRKYKNRNINERKRPLIYAP